MNFSGKNLQEKSVEFSISRLKLHFTGNSRFRQSSNHARMLVVYQQILILSRTRNCSSQIRKLAYYGGKKHGFFPSGNPLEVLEWRGVKVRQQCADVSRNILEDQNRDIRQKSVVESAKKLRGRSEKDRILARVFPLFSLPLFHIINRHDIPTPRNGAACTTSVARYHDSALSCSKSCFCPSRDLVTVQSIRESI